MYGHEEGLPVWRKPTPLGLTAVDRSGNVAGRIEGTLPGDGSDPEFALVRLGGRFAGRTAVPLRCSLHYDETLQFPYGLADMRDAPTIEAARFEEDQILSARTYWRTHRPQAGRVSFEAVAAAWER
jgi:hypothetical protein